MARIFQGLAASLLLIGSVLPATADTLLMEGIDEARPTAAERPARGSRMSVVEARWGKPEQRSDAVGQPPITRWQYSEFVVFFEYDHVIHTVRR